MHEITIEEVKLGDDCCDVTALVAGERVWFLRVERRDDGVELLPSMVAKTWGVHLPRLEAIFRERAGALR